jgi:hypothetical protein
MTLEIYLIVMLLMLASIYFVAPIAVTNLRRYRGTRIVTCPETRKTCAVEVDARHAAFTSLFSHPELRMKSCSRWPEREDCGEECLLQVQLSPKDCSLKNIVASWFEERYCVSCGKQILPIRWTGHDYAFLSPEGRTIRLSEIPAERVPDVLATHFPICWACQMAESEC